MRTKQMPRILALLLVAAVVLGAAGAAEPKVTLRLSHGQNPDSEVAQIVSRLAGYVEGDPGMNMDMIIYDSGVLGTERDMIEFVKAGVLDMAKVAASSLDAFNPYFSLFAMPYIFQSNKHYHNAMENSTSVKEIFASSRDSGFMAIGYYASGARNVYLCANIPADGAAALKGKKLRVMESPTAIRMITLMGATAVPMGTSEVYTALQQGVLDGAENTEMALTVNKHGEVVKSYTKTEHQYLPDIIIISTRTWNKLSERQREYLLEACQRNAKDYIESYDSMISKAVDQAKAMGVTFYENIDKSEFIRAVQPIHEDLKRRDANFARYYEDIQNFK